MRKMEVANSYKMTGLDTAKHNHAVYKRPENNSNKVLAKQCSLVNGKPLGHEGSARVMKAFQTSDDDEMETAAVNNSMQSCEDGFSALVVSIGSACIKEPEIDFTNAESKVSSTASGALVLLSKELGSGNGCLVSGGNMPEQAFHGSFKDMEPSLPKLVHRKPTRLLSISSNNNFLDILRSLPQKQLVPRSRKKLLVLDINGLLADIVYPPPKGYIPDTKIAGRAIFKRPSCSDFLNFCFEKFDVGVWSSRSKRIVDRVVHYLMGDMKQKLIFCWDLSHCTESNFRTLENKHKTLVFKELRKIWEKYDPDLPWERADYDESNTLLLDDSPYKALLNPPHTALFPYSYDFKDQADNAIGPGGNIRAYLEELSMSENVQEYIKKHPFGQSAITEGSLCWSFYNKVIKKQHPISAAR